MIGIGILWFSLSDHYELLMNVKFRPLTLTGAVLVLVLGVATVAGRRKGLGANMFVFAVMGAVCGSYSSGLQANETYWPMLLRLTERSLRPLSI